MLAAGESDFDARPLDPGIEAVRLLDDVGDKGAADTCSSFKEVEAAIRGRADPFRVGDAIRQSECSDQLLVKLRNLFRRDGGAVHRAGGEDTALVHELKGRLAVLVDGSSERVALPNDAVGVEDIARDEALQQMMRLAIAKLVEQRP